MCTMCDGQSLHDYLESIHTQIEAEGYAVVAVETVRGSGAGWAYTVGLIDGSGHPELVVAADDVREAHAFVDSVACQVTEGLRFDECDTALALGVDVGVRPVAREQLQRGLCNVWFRYYDGSARRDLDLEVLQVVLPDDHYCFEHQTTQPRLDTADDRFCAPNRAARRAMAREARRRR